MGSSFKKFQDSITAVKAKNKNSYKTAEIVLPYLGSLSLQACTKESLEESDESSTKFF